jgi:hypothetical protein
MYKSFANFEFMKKENQDLVERILLILANLFVSETNATSFMSSYYNDYKMMLKSLRFFINENQLNNIVV